MPAHTRRVFLTRLIYAQSRSHSRTPTRPACPSHAHLQPLFPAIFFPNFSFNTRCVPKPYSISTARISFWLLLQLYRSPNYSSNKHYFIIYYAIWTETSRFKVSVIWVFRYLRINVRLSLSSELQWLKIITLVPPSSRLHTTTTIAEESFELPNTWVSFSFLSGFQPSITLQFQILIHSYLAFPPSSRPFFIPHLHLPLFSPKSTCHSPHPPWQQRSCCCLLLLLFFSFFLIN